MTKTPYIEPPDEGIDVTDLLKGSSLTAGDQAALRRYQDALHIAIYWPEVENFRVCVKAYDDMLAVAKGVPDGAH